MQKEPGVVAFYTASDIPGPNSFINPVNIFFPLNEEILCDKEVKYYNQPLGIIVAESQKIAEKGASLVKVTYSNMKRPVVDLKVNKNDPSKVTVLQAIPATRTGADVEKVIKGENTIYGQYNFCMETLVCVTHPTEEGLKVYAATQYMDTVHQVVSRMLKLDQNR